MTPDRKVTVGALGGAVGVIFVYVLQAYIQKEIPAEVAMATQTLIIFGLQYLIANK